MDKQIFYKFEMGYYNLITLISNRSEQNLSDETISHVTVKSYDEKTAKNYRYCHVAEKRIIFKQSKISITNLIAQIEDLNEDCVKISRPDLLYV